MDPMKEPVAQNQCLLTIMVVLYKAKIALTGFRPGPRGAFRRRFCVALLYGHARRLTSKNGGSRPGQ